MPEPERASPVHSHEPGRGPWAALSLSLDWWAVLAALALAALVRSGLLPHVPW